MTCHGHCHGRNPECTTCAPRSPRDITARIYNGLDEPVSRPVVRGKNTINTINGECVGVRQTGDHLTVWVEGRDNHEVSVAGTPMTILEAEALARRINAVCMNMRKKGIK